MGFTANVSSTFSSIGNAIASGAAALPGVVADGAVAVATFSGHVFSTYFNAPVASAVNSLFVNANELAGPVLGPVAGIAATAGLAILANCFLYSDISFKKDTVTFIFVKTLAVLLAAAAACAATATITLTFGTMLPFWLACAAGAGVGLGSVLINPNWFRKKEAAADEANKQAATETAPAGNVANVQAPPVVNTHAPAATPAATAASVTIVPPAQAAAPKTPAATPAGTKLAVA